MKTIIFLLSFIYFAGFLEAQWIQTSGPDGATVYSLLADGNNLWMGSSRGVYLTTNNGSYWMIRPNGMPANYGVYSLLVKSNYVFAAQSNVGIFCSSDIGMTWIPCNNGLPSGTSFNAMQTINNVIIGGGSYNGVYLSTDNGASWALVGGASSIRSMLVNGNNVFAGGQNGVFKSTDNGYTWVLTSNSMGTIYGLTMIGPNLFAASYSAVYMSTNGGLNWTTQMSGFSGNIYCLTSLGANLFLGTNNNGIFKSSDFGVTWFPFNSGIYSLSIYAIVTSGNNLFAGTYNNGGVFFSTNAGTNWSPVNNNLPNLGINDLYVDGNNLYAATYYADIHRTTNNGDNWNILLPVTPATSFSAVTVINNYIFAGNGMYIYRSSDNGATWSTVYNGSCYSLSNNNGILFAGMNNSIVRSTDLGTTWFPTYTPGVYSFAFSGNNIYAGTGGNGQILLSSDNGVTWNILLSGSFGTVRAMAIYNNVIFAGTSSSGVLKSTDMGITWAVCNVGLGSTSISHMIMYYQNVFVTSDNIYVSTNYGSSWTIVSYGLNSAFPQRLAIIYPYIFVGTSGNSVWRRPLSEIVGVNDPGVNIPKDFLLGQNYPNPFNPVTNIKYQIAKSSYVQLKIYDLLGKEVATLVNSQLQPGTYSVLWDGTNYPSGVYFYRIQSGSFTDAKKMTLVK